MRNYDDINGTQKRKKFRQQIRRKQIDTLFRIQRHQLPPMTPSSAQQKCNNNFSQICNMMNCKYQNLNSQRLSILIKQLRQINCNHIVPSIFTNNTYINILLNLQKSQYLNKMDYIFLYQIFLNISAEENQDNQIKNINKISNQSLNNNLNSYNNLLIKQLTLAQNMQSNKSELIILSMQIMGNYLSKDQTNQTVYYLITKVKIYKLLIKLLFDRKQLFDRAEVCKNYYWFANRLISYTYQYKQNKIDEDCINLVKLFYQQLQDWLIINHNKQTIHINDFLTYMKTLIKTGDIQLSQQLIQGVQKYFDVNNQYYIDFLGKLTTYTLYSLPLIHLQQILQKLLRNPEQSLALNIIVIINNSLQNNNENWKTVMDYFIKFANIKVPNSVVFLQQKQNGTEIHQKYTIDYGKYGMLSYFMYFLHNSRTQQATSRLIKTLIIAQGGIGIFGDDCHYLIESVYMKKQLDQLGFQFQQAEQL